MRIRGVLTDDARVLSMGVVQHDMKLTFGPASCLHDMPSASRVHVIVNMCVFVGVHIGCGIRDTVVNCGRDQGLLSAAHVTYRELAIQADRRCRRVSHTSAATGAALLNSYHAPYVTKAPELPVPVLTTTTVVRTSTSDRLAPRTVYGRRRSTFSPDRSWDCMQTTATVMTMAMATHYPSGPPMMSLTCQTTPLGLHGSGRLRDCAGGCGPRVERGGRGEGAG